MNKKHLINILLILIIGVIAYANSFGNDFIYDDKTLIKENIHIKSFSNIKYVFKRGYFNSTGGFDFYRPLAAVLDMLDYSIWKLNPFGYHLTNFMLHFITTCLIYVLLFYFFRRYALALFLSLFFLTHPSATEAITYIAGRADPLAFIFLLVSFLLIIYFEDSNFKKRLYYAFSIISFILACLSKETAAIFPVFLLLYSLIHYKKQKHKIKSDILIVVPYFLIAAGALLLRYSVLKNAGNTFFNKELDIALFTRIINCPLIISKYVARFLFPQPFVFEQYIILYTSILNLPILISLPFVVIIIVLIAKFYKSRSAIGMIWFLTFIFPVSGIIPINAFLYHHWLYMPSLGLLIILADLLPKLDKRLKDNYLYGATGRYVMVFIGITVLIFFSTLTIRQNRYFKDEITFYQETIKKVPTNSRMHCNLGLVYAEKGRLEDAVSEFKTAIKLKPDYVDGYINLGYAYQTENLITEAEEIFQKAIAISPNSYLPYYYLANLYNSIGRAAEAVEFYKKSTNLNPKKPDIYFDLGRAYDKTGNKEEAIKAYQKCIELSPSRVDAYLNLGSIFAEDRQFVQAKIIWEKGLKYDPRNSDIKQNLTKLHKILRRN